jgi:hypothetical protein
MNSGVASSPHRVRVSSMMATSLSHCTLADVHALPGTLRAEPA